MADEHSLRDLMWSDVEVWADLWLAGKARRDRRRPYTLRQACWLAWSYAGLRATLVYRVSHALQRRRVPILPQWLGRVNIALHGFDIVPAVRVGPRLYIPHPVGHAIMAHQIGRDCTLVSCVTIGMRQDLQFPTIGDHVYVGAGARVLGAIRVGDNVKIGANAVVMCDVPDNCTAVGVPARILPPKTDAAEPPSETEKP